MTTAKTIAAVKRTKQFKALIDANFSLASSDRQLRNGTLVFQAKLGKGKRAKIAEYSITKNGAIISNKFTARRIDWDYFTNQKQMYKNGLASIGELINKRLGYK